MKVCGEKFKKMGSKKSSNLKGDPAMFSTVFCSFKQEVYRFTAHNNNWHVFFRFFWLATMVEALCSGSSRLLLHASADAPGKGAFGGGGGGWAGI